MMKICISMLMLAFTLLTASCSNEKNADPYNETIRSLDFTAQYKYVYMSSLEEMMDTAKPNLIVRCTVAKRHDAQIKDDSQKFSTNVLEDSTIDVYTKQNIASLYLTTPYDISVSNVYLGSCSISDEKKPSSTASDITLFAKYGVIGDYYRRDGAYPILEEGKEYILFLRKDLKFGTVVYNLAFPPVSAIELHPDGTFSVDAQDFADVILGDYEGSTKALVEDLERLISENTYDLSMDSFGTAIK